MTDEKGKITNLNTSLDTSAITAEAASWVAQLDGESINNADRLALREWASRSPKHMSELRRLGEIWLDIDAVLEAEIQKFGVRPSLRGVTAAAIKTRPKAASGLTAIAAALLFVCAFIWVSLPNTSEAPPVQIVYSVPYGENKVFNLDDGSTIHANTDSFLEVEYNQKQRIIRLIKGEAYFDVAHDAKRPFLVYANGSIVRAVGTAFSVRIGVGETSVIVTEGKVELISIKRGSAQQSKSDIAVKPRKKPTFVSAKESLTITAKNIDLVAEVKPISEDVINRKLAWRQGLVIFEGDPLVDVVDEISRYTDFQIIISDPEIRNIPIGGAFPAGKVDALLGALQTSFGISVERVSDDVIYLKKAVDN
ncbi:MAG: FecR domain-containing protein [Robiginitomaculum sp.]|nr:FecR domain-containing protein [Robiginitomaculum sp.]